MQQQADEEELGLSDAALAALREFALENNLGLDGGEGDIRLQVQEQMDVKERHHDFRFDFGGPEEEADGEQVSISLRGINPELGQTLASTGLTVWRGAEEMARFMWEHRSWFAGKSVVELGAGLGLCGVLASYLCRGGKVVITDGGEEFTESAMFALRENLERNHCDLGLKERLPPCKVADAPPLEQAQVQLEKLTWGEHSDFLEKHGGADAPGGMGEGFDFVVAADVIYYEEAVNPLLQTVADILKLRRDVLGEHEQRQKETRAKDDGNAENHSAVDGAAGNASARCPTEATFLLGFARRNVSIDRVLEEAKSLGLRWRIPSDFEPTCATENIYIMSLGEPTDV